MPSESMPSESMPTESMPGPGNGGSAKETLQRWLQLMASPQSGALQQLARNTEQEVVEEGDQWEDQQVRSSTSSLQ